MMLFPQMRRVCQINEYYCGPAVLDMLVSVYGLQFDQESVVDAANVRDRIKEKGMLLTEMGVALRTLAPDYQFWFKRNASVGELSSLVNTYHLPVGVEWQGIFDQVTDEDYTKSGYTQGDDDAGHYSVITGIDVAENWLTLANPFINKGVDDQYTILEFKRRWWDINEITDPATKMVREVDDYHALFVVTKVDDGTPELFNMTSEF